MAVWDLPTRLFHWALVALLVTSYVTAEIGELDWHFISGESILCLLLFRLLWGFFGSETARFTRFLRGPRAVWHHLATLRQTAHGEPPGHNAAGGWAVVAMLLALCAQAGTGLFADDDISSEGPLAQFVDHATSRRITGLHHRIFWVLAALAALHVCAIATYRLVRRQDLVGPMITGRKTLPPDTPAPRLRPVWLAALFFAAAAGAAYWVASLSQ